MSIRRKLALYFGIIVLLPLLVLAFVLLRSSQVKLRAQSLEKFSALASARKDQVQLFVDAARGRIIDFSSDGKIKDCLDAINKKMASVCTEKDLSHHLLVNKLPAVQGLLTVSVVNKTGTIVASSLESEVEKDVSKEQFFAHTARYGDNVEIEMIDGKPLMIVTQPVQRITGGSDVLGYISGTMSIDGLRSFVQSYENLGTTGEILLAIKKEMASVPVFLFPRRFETEALALASQDSNQAIPMKQALERKAEFLDTAPDYRGIQVIAATNFIDLGRDTIGVVVKMDATEIDRSLESQARTTIAVFLFAFILALLIASIIARSFAAPLEELSKKAKEVSAGNYDIHFSQELMESGSEIGGFAGQFIQTVRDLEELKNDLEAKVEERTRELDDSKQKIQEKLNETERLNKIMVERELKMIELKKRIAELEGK